MTPFDLQEPGSLVLPGFVDIQLNGGFGHDFTTDPASIWEVARLLPRHGVTAFVPTVVTAPVERALSALEVLAKGPPPGWQGAKPLGLHLEGPMISADRPGIHLLRHLRLPTEKLVNRLIGAGPPLMVTLAPELDGAKDASRALLEAGVTVSFGHSDASVSEAEAAFGWGVNNVTHLFNAMSGVHHRQPGLATAVLNSKTATAGVIADGVHLHPAILRLIFGSLGPSRIALVTDAMAALGMTERNFHIGGAAVTVDGFAVRNDTGVLAGSAAPMDHVVRVMKTVTGCTNDELGEMASATPARIAGYHQPADDLVLLNQHLEVVATAIGGDVVYRKEQA